MAQGGKNIFEPMSDDCAICLGMEKASREGRELTLSELEALFMQANKEQADKWYEQRSL